MESDTAFTAKTAVPRLSTTLAAKENPNKKIIIALAIAGPVCLVLIILALASIFSNKSTNEPVYQSCDFAFRTYDHGKTWTTEDGCQECRCNNGDIICNEESLCEENNTDVGISIIPSESAEPSLTVTPTATLTIPPVTAIPSTGTIQGNLSGPPAGEPQNHVMKACAENQSTGQLYCTNDINITPSNYNPPYSLQVPSGQYTVYSYETSSPGTKIYYDQMVTCGFLDGCPADIIIITVQGGKTLSDIDPTDWYTEH